MSTATTTFERRVLEHRDRLMRGLGVIVVHQFRAKTQLDSRDPARVSSTPHDHVVAASVDLMDEFALVFAASLDGYGLTNEVHLPLDDVAFYQQTDEFSLGLEVASLRRFDPEIVLEGMLRGGTWLELGEFDGVVELTVWGLKHGEIPEAFNRETLAEALCSERDGRRKQAFFAYVSAIDSLLNYELTDVIAAAEDGDAIRKQELKNKLSAVIALATGLVSLSDSPLYSRISDLFNQLIKARNAIAHSIERVVISKSDVEAAVFVSLVLNMVIERGTLDLEVLTDHYRLKDKVRDADRMPKGAYDDHGDRYGSDAQITP